MNEQKKRKIKTKILRMIILISFFTGLGLTLTALSREFGFWFILGKLSIAETKNLYTNQTFLIIPGNILLIFSYIVMVFDHK